MPRISAFTIVRNEELLIAKHLAELARLAKEVVCVVQPSTDCTLLFARNTAAHLGALGTTCHVVEHEPERLGKEFSLAFALERCTFDWCFNLDADEAYVGCSPDELVERASSHAAFLSIAHFQAVGCTPEAWFKSEPVRAKVRLFDRKRLDTGRRFALHVGLDPLLRDEATVHVPATEARIVEYKAAWQHYLDQLFYEWEGSPVHEAPACRAVMRPQSLELGETAFRLDRGARRKPAEPSRG
jgi:hypothetical protein